VNLSAHFDYLPAAPEHWPWILGTFQAQLADMRAEYTNAQAWRHAQRLAALMRGGICEAIVACPKNNPDVRGGWAARQGGTLVFVYVRDWLRQSGIGSQLATKLTDAVPMRLAYWTPTAQAVRDHGFPLVYDRDAYQAIARFEQPTRHLERILCEQR